MAPRTKPARLVLAVVVLAVAVLAGGLLRGAILNHTRTHYSYDPAKQVAIQTGTLAGSPACPYITDGIYRYAMGLGNGLVARERNGRLLIFQGQQVLAGAGDKVKGTSRPGEPIQLVTDCLGQRAYRFTVGSLVKWDGR